MKLKHISALAQTHYKHTIAALFVLPSLYVMGCGVKGDPLPPLQPTELSRGKPTYKRATKDILFKNNESDEDEDNKKKDKKK